MMYIDNFLNRITMYRLMLYFLIVLIGAAFAFSLFGILPYDPVHLAFSTLVILASCYVANIVFANIAHAIPNVESVYITAGILALIMNPVAPTDASGIVFLFVASVLAMASKYIVVHRKKHIFNPAAFGVAMGALLLGELASWWVASTLTILPIIIVGGLLVVRKMRRFDLVLTFMFVALATIVLTAQGSLPSTVITQTFLHSTFFFLAFVMLTEPLTMPPSRWLRIAYAAIVGILFAPHIHFGSYYVTPEVALLVGNLFAYLVSPKGRFMLTLVEKKQIAANTYEFAFAPDRPIVFRAGQYMEWTLDVNDADNRGNRRYFTIASSPTEQMVRLGVKSYAPASAFKKTLQHTEERSVLTAAQVSGDFVLPKDKNRKLVCIAGGIGVTPFRSMAQYLIDTKEHRTITLFYSNTTLSEIAYKDIFDAARKEIGMKTIYALTNEPASIPGTHTGPIDAELIRREVPDYQECMFFISGPHGMVEAFKATLASMGVSRLNIRTDYFPGFV